MIGPSRHPLYRYFMCVKSEIYYAELPIPKNALQILPILKYFTLNPPSHTPQFYVCGILISKDHVHVQ
jgi:hypothetical protein